MLTKQDLGNERRPPYFYRDRSSLTRSSTRHKRYLLRDQSSFESCIHLNIADAFVRAHLQPSATLKFVQLSHNACRIATTHERSHSGLSL